MDTAALLDPRVLLVTGKGGVGKSTIAAALALAASRTGRRTGLVEVEGRQTMARVFSSERWDFEEREIRPDLFGMSVDPEASLSEYLEMFYGARRLSKFVVGSTAVEFATTAAPGIKDVLLIGKVKEMERRRDASGRFHYDLVIVDAPPTGRIVNFLRAPEATTELVGVGPIRQQAQSVVDMLLDPDRTHVQLVTLLEEMPVEETIAGAAALEELGVAISPVIVNRVLPARLDPAAHQVLDDGLDPSKVAAIASEAGVDLDRAAVDRLLDRGQRHLARLALQDRMRTALTDLDVPATELPFIASREFREAEVSQLAVRIVDLVA